ncbi:uncharacterized protein LOC105947760 [Xenopus tropicalis]|uniref:Uncharacterized protein LOC105947760 n=1 Tax=Xenopus tropicalis TaxID=8364 RepID=A0A8J0SRA1_XENTR|nr:uncharacterized protein LOC105947760 [Xenopus tropicalis]
MLYSSKPLQIKQTYLTESPGVLEDTTEQNQSCLYSKEAAATAIRRLTAQIHAIHKSSAEIHATHKLFVMIPAKQQYAMTPANLPIITIATLCTVPKKFTVTLAIPAIPAILAISMESTEYSHLLSRTRSFISPTNAFNSSSPLLFANSFIVVLVPMTCLLNLSIQE